MSDAWLLEDLSPARVRPAPLFEDLRALAGRWQSRPSGQCLASGVFESQADAEELLARLNAVRHPDDADEVLAAAQSFARLDRVLRPQELQRVLLPYEQPPLPAPFASR